jgi:c-di-GMP-binding flagellar brake protein YcgR
MNPYDHPPRRFIELRKYRRLAPPPGSLLSFTRLARPVGAPDEETGDGTILNLSPGGCKIASEGMITVGQPYSLILQLPSFPAPISIDAAIVRWIGEDAFGFKFDALQPEQEEQLRDFLHRLRSAA